MEDETGHWPKCVKSIVKKVEKVIKTTVAAVKKVVRNVVNDVKNFNIKNTNEQKVLESNYFSAYKGVPVVRIPANVRSGSLGIIYLSKNTSSNDLVPEDIVRHEYGHTKQFQELGLTNYLITVGIPSYLNLGKEWGNNECYNKPWEVMANVYGGVEEYQNSQNDINAAYKYHRGSQKVGPLILVFIE